LNVITAPRKEGESGSTRSQIPREGLGALIVPSFSHHSEFEYRVRSLLKKEAAMEMLLVRIVLVVSATLYIGLLAFWFWPK
jgi:hypothetical protein